MKNAVLVNPAPTPAKLLPAALCTAALLQIYFIKDQLSAPSTAMQNGDNLTRLAQVRDLMAGQGWFDLMQYRLGVAPGVEMHWSRLVDAPIALLVWLGNLLGLSESLAFYAWPALTGLSAIAAMLYGFRRLAPDLPLLSACVIGGFALIGGGAFRPGAFDHHNIQTALALWLIALLIPGPFAVRNHAIAGLLAALMLAIGMETLPYVVAASAYLALMLVADEGEAANARAFGVSVAVSVSVLFAGLVGPDRYSSAACDSFSSFHLVMAAGGGIMLAGIAQLSMTPRTRSFRLAAMIGIAAIALALLLVLFPHCLADPLVSLDPRLKKFWLDGVLEAQGISALIKLDPFMLPGMFGLPVVALIVSCAAIRAEFHVRAHILFALMLLIAVLVTAWQMRGVLFAIPFAATPLSLLVARLSARGARPLKLVSAWLISISLSWGLAGAAAAQLATGQQSKLAQAIASGGTCEDPALLSPLAREPAGVVLGNTNLGPAALLHTAHRVIAGPYHRNTAGNLLLIDVMTKDSESAHASMRSNGVTLLAVCAGGPDENDFTAFAPQGFLANLLNGTKYDWLEPVESAQNQQLRFWRVKS
jgi:hypothetical protein